MDLRTVATNLTYITLDAPEEVTSDHILGGVTWTTDTEIAVHWLNRRQNYTILRICNLQTNRCIVSLNVLYTQLKSKIICSRFIIINLMFI